MVAVEAVAEDSAAEAETEVAEEEAVEASAAEAEVEEETEAVVEVEAAVVAEEAVPEAESGPRELKSSLSLMRDSQVFSSQEAKTTSL